MKNLSLQKNEFHISTDKSKLDIDAIHDFLSTKAYWSLNIPKEKVEISIKIPFVLVFMGTLSADGNSNAFP